MEAVNVNISADDGSPGRAGYRRSAGSPRGEARRRELLDRLHGLMMDASRPSRRRGWFR